MLRRSLTCLLLLAAASALSCGSPDRPRAVVLIVIDTLRADHLGSYGFADAHTPHLDALASRGVRFADAFSAVPVTLPSVSTILTGKYPFDHGVRDNSSFVLADEQVTLAERMRDAGYATGAVVGSAVLSADRGVSQGFDHYDDAFQGPFPFYQADMQSLARDLGDKERRADVVTDRAKAMLDQLGDGSFFLLVHYFDPHAHYDPPPQYRDLHPQQYYDGEISFVDAEIGRLLEALPDDALIVVVGDHGEGLYDHDEPSHGFFLYQATLHVPWIVAGPGVPQGLVREDPVSLVDVAPTLAAACDLPATKADGRILTWDQPETAVPTHYAETFRTLVSYGWSELRALRHGPLKVIQGPHDYEFYDLQNDPAELRDLGMEAPEGAALAAQLADLVRDDDPERVLQIAEGMPDTERNEALEALGYVGGDEPAPAAVDRPHPRDAAPKFNERQRRKMELRSAMSYVERGEVEPGLRLLEKVLAEDPDNVAALYYQGLALEHAGQKDEGLRVLLRAQELDPDFAPLQLEFAYREDQAGKFDASRERLQRVLVNDPDNVQALAMLSQSYLRQGKWQEAAEALRDLVLLQPDDPLPHFHLARAAQQLGLREEAVAHYQILQDKFPTFAREKRVEKILESLQ